MVNFLRWDQQKLVNARYYLASAECVHSQSISFWIVSFQYFSEKEYFHQNSPIFGRSFESSHPVWLGSLVCSYIKQSRRAITLLPFPPGGICLPEFLTQPFVLHYYNLSVLFCDNYKKAEGRVKYLIQFSLACFLYNHMLGAARVWYLKKKKITSKKFKICEL